MNRRWLSRVFVLGIWVLLPFVPEAASAATPISAEAYPPAAVVNLIDPFGCAPATISGNIGAVLPGSTVTLQLVLLGGAAGEVPLATVTVTAGADGHAIYSIPVPPNRFGPVVVRANGSDTLSQPFALETSGTLVDCPRLPETGSSGLGNWLRSGAALMLAGVVLVVVAMRRGRHSMSKAG